MNLDPKGNQFSLSDMKVSDNKAKFQKTCYFDKANIIFFKVHLKNFYAAVVISDRYVWFMTVYIVSYI